MEAFAPGSPGLPAGPASLAPGLPACCQRGLPAWPLVCQPAGRACQPAPWACQLGLQACQLRLLGCPQGLPACVMGRLATSWACQPACHLGLPLCHMALRAGHWACQPPGLPPGSLNWAAPGPPTWTLSSEPACHPSLSQEVKIHGGWEADGGKEDPTHAAKANSIRLYPRSPNRSWWYARYECKCT